MSFLKFCKILFKIKIFIKSPPKSDLIIYDRMTVTSGFANALFKNKKYTILDTRYESINLYILFLCFINFKFTNLRDSYKKLFLSTVQPKIVYTSIDNNPSFFNLKNLYSKTIYISDQNGVAKVNGQTWPNDFSVFCKKFNKKNKRKLQADLIFVFNKNDKKQMAKFLKGNIHDLGNSKCNNFVIKKKKKKIKKIIFINSGLYKETISKEIKIFRHLNAYSKKNNIKLTMLSRKDNRYEKFYRDKFGNGNWIYAPRSNSLSSYKALTVDSVIVFSHSTFGLEALAIGHKCVIILHDLAKKNMNWKHKNNGFFWTNKINYNSISTVINRVKNIKHSEWPKRVKEISNFYLFHDPENKTKKKLIKKIINNL
jgi:hypothetical protein